MEQEFVDGRNLDWSLNARQVQFDLLPVSSRYGLNYDAADVKLGKRNRHESEAATSF